MYIFIRKTFLFLLIVIPMYAFTFLNAEAAIFFFESSDSSIGFGGEAKISLFIDTENEQINAIEGVVSFPNDTVEIIEINDGESVIDIWIQKPKVTKDGIIFSGIITGGFDVVHDPVESEKNPGRLFTFILRSKSTGVVNVMVKDTLALLNDGTGSSVNTISLPLSIEVLDYFGTAVKKESPDTELPEEFFPEIIRDENIFGGKYLLIFYAQDKKSGIDHYEISENIDEWVIAESPYVLKDQSLSSIVKVKAIDKSGNERIVELSVTYPQELKYKSYLRIIIVLLVVYILFIKRKNIFKNIMKLWGRISTKQS